MSEHYLRFLEENNHTPVVIGVPESDEEPGFAYTVGFTHICGLPELFLYGGEGNDAETLLNTLASELKDDPEVLRDQKSVKLGVGFNFVPMSPRMCQQYLVMACIKYGNKGFKAVKIELDE